MDLGIVSACSWLSQVRAASSSSVSLLLVLLLPPPLCASRRHGVASTGNVLTAGHFRAVRETRGTRARRSMMLYDVGMI